jgi:hypothetical protein
MSFRIDIATKDGVIVTLVVVRDQINILFSKSNHSVTEELPYLVRENFGHLTSHFKQDHQQEFVRGGDSEHIKRHHGSSIETQTPHQHFSFDRDVTPEMLTQFLEGILKGQSDHKTDEQYQFIDVDMVKAVTKRFAYFYSNFYGSSLQKQFMEERQLTQEEKESLVNHAKMDTGILGISDKEELKLCGFDVDKIAPKPTVTNRSGKISLQDLLGFMFLGGGMISSSGNTLVIMSDDEEIGTNLFPQLN